MVINDKGLIKAMKEARKTEGYSVSIDDTVLPRKMILRGPGWLVICEAQSVPRKVLALIVEHMGNIPTPRTAYRVKSRDVQTEIFETAEVIEESVALSGTEERELRETALDVYGNGVWQAVGNQAVMVSKQLLSIATIAGAVLLTGGNWVHVPGDLSQVYVETFPDTYKEAYKILQALSVTAWPSR